jgi:threonine/homoserine/homoserine lactone efflux protein
VLSHALTGFGIGVALGVSPGPVQVLLLTEAARGGLRRGFRAMAGANGTFLALLLLLAAGVAAVAPGGAVLRVLEVLGGLFLLWVAAEAAREVVRGGDLERAEAEAEAEAAARASGRGRRGRAAVLARPAVRGTLAVVLNPGARVFLATTGTALVADATADGGRAAAVETIVALMAGVSVMDTLTVLVGSGGGLLKGPAGRWVRLGLTLALAAIGAWFVVRGVVG